MIKAVDDPEAEWEVEAVVKKRVLRRRGRNTSPKTQYLIRWKGFGPEYDEWKEEEELEGCSELVKEYESSTGNTTWTRPPSWAAPDAPDIAPGVRESEETT